ncbi:MAG: low molecular weight phosphotyrosine protein phosphatase [bacterium]|nr:low molecular weight phosphotyrosine protein phosphatase [bacterium]
MPDLEVRSVLFVCLGNICRSPTAEGVMHKLIGRDGLESKIHVDSAGTIGYHTGEPADLRMQEAAARREIPLASVSRQIERADFDRFDLIIAMDRENLRDLRALDSHREGQLRLFSEFLPPGSAADVPDPYYGQAGFDRVIDIVEQGCPAILEHLLRGS